MNYLLIFWLTSNASLVAAPPAVVFSDLAACQAGLQSISDTWRGPPQSNTATIHNIVGVCVPQATAPVVVAPPLTPVPPAGSPWLFGQ